LSISFIFSRLTLMTIITNMSLGWFTIKLPEPPINTVSYEVIEEQIVEPEPNPIYGFTEDDIYLLAQLLCGDKNRDGDGEYDFDFSLTMYENYQQISLVLCVIMNRVMDPRFPNNVYDVIWAYNSSKDIYQFSVMRQWANGRVCQPSELALTRVREWCDAYDRGDPGAQTIPTNHVYFTGNGTINISKSG